MRRERDDVLLAGQPVGVRADPPLAEPQVPRRPRGRAARAASRAVKRPSVDLGGRRRPRRRRGGCRATSRRRAGVAAAASPATIGSDAALHADAAAPRRAARAAPRRPRAGRPRRVGPHPHEPRARPTTTPTAPSRVPASSSACSPRLPAAGRGERGERQLGLALVLAGAERRTQRLGAVAAQHQLGRVDPVAPTTSMRPSSISTRRATASAVPPAATRPRVPARSAAPVAPGGAGERDVGVGEQLRRRRPRCAGSAWRSPTSARAARRRRARRSTWMRIAPPGGMHRAGPEVVALRRALEHVAVEVDRAGGEVGDDDVSRRPFGSAATPTRALERVRAAAGGTGRPCSRGCCRACRTGRRRRPSRPRRRVAFSNTGIAQPPAEAVTPSPSRPTSSSTVAPGLDHGVAGERVAAQPGVAQVPAAERDRVDRVEVADLDPLARGVGGVVAVGVPVDPQLQRRGGARSDAAAVGVEQAALRGDRGLDQRAVARFGADSAQRRPPQREPLGEHRRADVAPAARAA